LETKPSGTTLTDEQQQKLNSYDEVARQRQVVLKEIKGMFTKVQYAAFIQQNNIK